MNFIMLNLLLASSMLHLSVYLILLYLEFRQLHTQE